MGGGKCRAVASIEAAVLPTTGLQFVFHFDDFLGCRRRINASMNVTTALDYGLSMGGMRVGGGCAGNIFISLGMRTDRG